ncbi:MAG: hypothetical protein AAF135_18730 [Bacteroidota bacterium]
MSFPLIHFFSCLTLCGIVLTLYYGGIFAWVAYRAQKIDHVDLPDIETLSPMTLRYLWIGNSDWNLLIVNFFSAVKKGVYRLTWKSQSEGFIMDLIDPMAFRALPSEERVGLGFNGHPLNRIITRAEKTKMIDSLMLQVDHSMRKNLKNYHLPTNLIFVIGFLLTSAMVLGLMYVWAGLDLWSLIPVGIFMFFLAFYTQFVLGKWIDDTYLERQPGQAWGNWVRNSLYMILWGKNMSAKDTQWYQSLLTKISLAAQVGIVIFIMYQTNSLLTGVFWILVIAQLFLYLTFSQLNASGTAIQRKIQAYREELIQSDGPEDAQVPKWIALDLPCREMYSIAELYTGRQYQGHKRYAMYARMPGKYG